MLPRPHLLGGWQSWALAGHSLAETGFSLGEFLSEVSSRSACLPWARFALPSRAGRWVAGWVLPLLLTSRWTVVDPGPLPGCSLDPWPPGPLWAARLTSHGSPHPRCHHAFLPLLPLLPLGAPPTRGHPKEVALVGLCDTVQGRGHCPRRNPVWPASQTSHPADRAQGPAVDSPGWVHCAQGPSAWSCRLCDLTRGDSLGPQGSDAARGGLCAQPLCGMLGRAGWGCPSGTAYGEDS